MSLISLIFLSQFLFAQEAQITAPVPQSSRLAPEISYQVQSLPLIGSQLIGPALSYEVVKNQRLGARYLFSTESSQDRRLSIYWRLSVGKKNYHWLFEPQISYIWSRSQYSVTGLSGGLNFDVSPDIVVGGLVGVEQVGAPFPFGTFWNRPFLILITQFQF